PPPVRTHEPPLMLRGLLRAGFTLAHLPDNFAKSGYAPQLSDPIPPLMEVSERSLQYDIADVARFRNHSLSGGRLPAPCPWPAELLEANPVWGQGCFRPPEDAHPQGLRVMFAFNTNLWAAANRSSIPQLDGPVGLFGPQQDPRASWWSQRSEEQGVGNRACSYLPPALQLRSRCRCRQPTACGAEQAALLAALQAGRLPVPPGREEAEELAARVER
ncbi:hypothetical protein Agub_g15528, partial [Astrephomene gubernaculifera]